MEYTHVTHTFGPVFDSASHILILGSFPSVKSREQNFYYGHPQNRFWHMLAALFPPVEPLYAHGCPEAKRAFLQKHRLALWDVIESCDIIGSSDSSIKNVVPNDMSRILGAAPIARILCNGGTAYRLFQKYCMGSDAPSLPEVRKLPSTSPANAAWNLERLIAAWKPWLRASEEP